MIRRKYDLRLTTDFYWILEHSRWNRGCRFEPLISRRDAYIVGERKRLLNNKYTVGTA